VRERERERKEKEEGCRNFERASRLTRKVSIVNGESLAYRDWQETFSRD